MHYKLFTTDALRIYGPTHLGLSVIWRDRSALWSTATTEPMDRRESTTDDLDS